ncbi:hypothetical protein NKH47_04910 [Mesorhizobium sp. M1060]|uniref:hypothetical protein n=1 Tax=unclassified Mesorhizobium TaxID=325217 RepID=UPI0003D024A0|nr:MULTISPECIES: hypothetical protein [unclassified Mesorhizobium]ESZ06440.1 hypothetical protein X736_10695 [Mesorhizobium sp. L2C089B000]WJI52511.1 hypothetical protein NLY44_07515 [Mesorhizobium sp. C089B]
MAMVKHVLKRILMMLAGYFVSVLIGLFAVVAIYCALAVLPNAPDYFGAMQFSPIVVLLWPPLGMVVYFLTIVLTGLQTLIFALLAEFFALRNFLVHMLFGAAAAAAGFFLVWPAAEEDAGHWADIGIIAAAGLVAGLVYWLIAGRDAGFRRPLIQR